MGGGDRVRVSRKRRTAKGPNTRWFTEANNQLPLSLFDGTINKPSSDLLDLPLESGSLYRKLRTTLIVCKVKIGILKSLRHELVCLLTFQGIPINPDTNHVKTSDYRWTLM